MRNRRRLVDETRKTLAANISASSSPFEHIFLSHFPPIFFFCARNETTANSLDKDVFTLSFSLTHFLFLLFFLSIIQHNLLIRYVRHNWLCRDTWCSWRIFAALLQNFYKISFFSSGKFHRSRISESRQVYRMSRKKSRKLLTEFNSIV